MNLHVFPVGGITPLPQALTPCFDDASRTLSRRDYGGPMENLWIEVEVHEYGMNIPDRPPRPFRYQRRVSPRLPAGLGPAQVYANVGHYSVRPTQDDMRSDSIVVAARRVLKVVIDSTDCLAGRKQIAGFSVATFRSDLAAAFEAFVFPEDKERRMSGRGDR